MVKNERIADYRGGGDNQKLSFAVFFSQFLCVRRPFSFEVKIT